MPYQEIPSQQSARNRDRDGSRKKPAQVKNDELQQFLKDTSINFY